MKRKKGKRPYLADADASLFYRNVYRSGFGKDEGRVGGESNLTPF